MNLLLLETLHADAESVLAAAGTLVHAIDPGTPPADLSAVRAIVTRGRGRIDDALMNRCPDLAVIARAGVGLDNLDVAAARRRGIPVIYAPSAGTSTVAEHTIALMLDLVRGITRTARQVACGAWGSRASYAGEEIGALTLGLVGLGRIGRRTAELAAAFGMQVVAATHRGGADVPVARVPLDELLSTADVISLHVPLTPATRGMIGARELARMKRGAFLVNTARGALIDMPALRAAIAGGTLGGFGADVLDVEPPAADDPLLTSDRVVITPHVASLTSASYRSLCVSTARNVVRVLRGEPPDPTSVFRVPAD